MSYRPTDLAGKFWEKVDVRLDDECWNWLGWIKHGKTGGYGLLRIYEPPVSAGKFKDHRANRLAWELHHGEAPPEELHVCHDCDNPRCVNPHHLFLGTAKDNQQDKMQKGRYQNGNSVKTHCLRGHELVGDNLIVQKDGRRNCKACARQYWRETYYPRLKERNYYGKRSNRAADL